MRSALLTLPAALLALTLAACGGGGGASTGTGATSATPEPTVDTSGLASVGDSLTFEAAGGREVRVKLQKVFDPAPVMGGRRPPSGKRWVGVPLKLTNTGRRSFIGAPASRARVVTQDGTTLKPVDASPRVCGEPFGRQVRIRRDKVGRVCPVFEVDARAKLGAFEITLAEGFPERPGGWSLRST